MQTCERCERPAPGEYDLHDYCLWCSKNLCEKCMRGGRCLECPGGRHMPSGDSDEPVDDGSGMHPDQHDEHLRDEDQ